MRKLLSFMFLSLCLMLASAIYAQDRPIAGKVSGEDNKPLSGVTVTVKGTNRQTITDANGNFSIVARTGSTLQFTSVGRKASEYTVTEKNTVDLVMDSKDDVMSEVVVTAMDIRRNPRELGYAASKVDGEEIKETQRENFLNGLQGRVAGLTVNSSGGQAGASSSVVLRGFNSMALDNQPLYVIDGIVLDNQTINETSNSNSGLGLVESSSRNVNQTSNRMNDYTNRAADLNPNDIESITVLKGPEATALYGSQASSGAIIITTKKGKADGKVAVSYDNAFRVQEMTRFPEVQNVYGNGNNGTETSEFRYFGPKYAPGTKIYDNIDAFFKTGFSQTHNLSVDFGKKNATFRASGSLFDQSGVIPENTFKRYTFRITNSTKITKTLEIIPSLTYTSSINEKPLRGASGYMLNLLVYPNNFDVRDYQDNDGNKKTIFNASPNAELDNPFFSVNNNRSKDETKRITGTFGLNFNPLSWLSFAARVGYDTYESNGFTFYHPYSFYLTRGQGGAMDNYYKDYTGYNHTITATAKKTFGDFSTRLMLGNMWQDYETQMHSVYGTNLVDSVTGSNQMMKDSRIISQTELESWMGDSSRTRSSSRLRLNNARKGLPNYVINRQLAYFGEVSVGYKNFLFLTYTHRFESSSIFPKEFRNYNYPAGSLSLIVSDLFPALKSNLLNYWKLRTSLASTARSSAPYRNQSVFNVVTSSGGGYAYGLDNNNFFLEPEIQKTYEVGTELTLFNRALNLDITYYNTLCEKQIAEGFRASYGTGYVLNTINVGSTRNQGIEISAGITPIKKQDFTWNIRFNFNKMWNEVISLPANVPEFYISDTWVYLNARGGLVKGGPTTAITSFKYLRNKNNQLVIDPATGLAVTDPAGFKVTGDRNPDFTLGTINSFRYKNWSLNFLWDLKVGGDIFNGTDMYLTSVGKSLRTLDRETPRVIEGVLRDGKENTDNPTPNNIVVTPYFNTTSGTGFYAAGNMPEEVFIEKDVNWFRLRDLSLSYALPTQSLKNLRYVKSLSFFVTANDLVLFTNYTGADPAANGNTAGTRGVGGWGFDYGNIGAPVSVNFGLRAGF